jgi:hypothetical protein
VDRIVPADAGVLERALAGVERTPVPPETSYLGELFRAARNAVLEAMLRGAEMLNLSAGTLKVIAGILAAVALYLVVRTVLPRLRRKKPGAQTGEVSTLPAPAADWDAAAWRAEMESRLAAGQVAQALEAAWWWLARSVAGSRAEPDWTSRDLLAHARRDRLAEPVRRLDAFIYGPRHPQVDDVRQLVARLEEALP